MLFRGWKIAKRNEMDLVLRPFGCILVFGVPFHGMLSMFFFAFWVMILTMPSSVKILYFLSTGFWLRPSHVR